MQTIGFTNVYYTLWQVGEPYEEKQYYKGLCIGSTWKQDVIYIQNLSMDFEKAKSKLNGDYKIDLELRGHSSFTRTVSSDIKNREEYFPQDCFSFGWFEGTKIMECDNVWQIERAFREEKSARRRACARRRLIDLEILVRYTWYKDNNRCNYATPEHVEEMEIAKYFDSLEKGHLFEDGQKVEIEIKRIPSKSFSFQGAFGRTYIETYVTRCGKLVKYMGSSPIDISEKDFTKVQATIKHDFYTEAETKLIRIKDITDYSHLIHPNTEESARAIYKMAMDDDNITPEYLDSFKKNYKKFKLGKSDYSETGELNMNGLVKICNVLGI